MRCEFTQCFTLPELSPTRRLDDPILHSGEQLGTSQSQPIQDVVRQPPVVRACFDYVNLARVAFDLRLQTLDFRLFQPFRELKRQQFPEQWPHTDARVEVAAPADRVIFLFIISTIRTIQSEFHEAREGNCACNRDFCPDYVGHSLQMVLSV